MPRVAFAANVKPSGHSLAARSRAAAADPKPAANPFAALLDGAGDASPPPSSADRRQAGSTVRSASRSDTETRIESSTPRARDDAGSADRASPADPEPATLPDRAAPDETADAGAEAKPGDGLGDGEAATIEATDAALLAIATGDAAGQPPPADDPTAAPAAAVAPVAGLKIAARMAAPPAQDAIAAATDLVASNGATTVDPGLRGPAQRAVAGNDKPGAEVAAGSTDGEDPRAIGAAPSPQAKPAPTDTDGAESQSHGDAALPEGKTEHAHSGPAPRRDGVSLAADRSSSPAPTHGENRTDDMVQAARPPVDGLHLGSLQHPLDRNLTSGVAQTGATANTSIAAAVPIEGLAVEIAARAQAGRNRFEIRLDPPELGRIDVRLDVDRGGHVTSRLVVERAETLDLLRRDAAELERALQQAGLKTSDNGLQFALRDQAFAGRDDGGATPETARLIVPDADLEPLDAAQRGYGGTSRRGTGVDIRV